MLHFFFWGLFAIILLAGAGMQWSEKLITVSQPAYKKNFMIRLQFAKTRELLKDMIASVTGRGRDALGFNLGLDYAFMIGLYGFIALFSYRVTENHPQEILQSAGATVSFMMLIPWITDIFENYCLARWSFNDNWKGPFVLYYFAVRCKWLVAAVAGAFCLTVFVYNLVKLGKGFNL
ncbi:MAG: hypothetical protein SFU87_02670 [Chitinophagaceae bacterium]|nr:hypothetical protein [Chitinophagaceae bacterium]